MINLFSWYKFMILFISRYEISIARYKDFEHREQRRCRGAQSPEPPASPAFSRYKLISPFTIVVQIDRSVYFNGTNQSVHLFSWYEVIIAHCKISRAAAMSRCSVASNPPSFTCRVPLFSWYKFTCLFIFMVQINQSIYFHGTKK